MMARPRRENCGDTKRSGVAMDATGSWGRPAQWLTMLIVCELSTYRVRSTYLNAGPGKLGTVAPLLLWSNGRGLVIYYRLPDEWAERLLGSWQLPGQMPQLIRCRQIKVSDNRGLPLSVQWQWAPPLVLLLVHTLTRGAFLTTESICCDAIRFERAAPQAGALLPSSPLPEQTNKRKKGGQGRRDEADGRKWRCLQLVDWFLVVHHRRVRSLPRLSTVHAFR
ncbi:hypothetical protein IF1G_07158 [Cordyceps javanica]|uniref:Uncharacterized protein n=1 Tax=Cordyceps javanica TaxID=43265 RepID=A0A545UXU9_9HYPO|nr:hypothetical protein IF1G_07158 [Cordyceps javanica]